MTEHATFAVAINCIDGRAQAPVSGWMKQHLSVDYIDVVTEPGPDLALLQGAHEVIGSVIRRVQVSIQAHHSRVIAIAGHHGCAANPATREKHIEQIRSCVNVIRSWGLPVRVLGLWVNETWQVEVVHDTEKV